jgi:predicted kinase
VARRLEDEGLVRISFDGEAWARGHRTMPLPESVHDEIEAELRSCLVQLVSAGRDVVLDFSFWSRAMREKWRAIVELLGVVPETYYVTTDRSTALARVRTRHGSDLDDFQLTEDIAGQYFDGFEPPTADEGPLTVIST